MNIAQEEDESDHSDIDSQEFKFYFWNNWVPDRKLQTRIKREDRVTSAAQQCSKTVSKIGNWIPPDRDEFGRPANSNVTTVHEGPSKPEIKTDMEDGKENLAKLTNVFQWNEDWGERSANFSVAEGLVWNLFSPSLFGVLKLTINSYGNIKAYADAEYISSDSETVLITINNETHLRKLLAISNHEWTAFTEALKVHNENVSYDALRVGEWQRLKPLQQMWYMICKRRHLLPSLCLRLKEAGVQKMTQYLKILPKFVVVDVRTCSGKLIP